MAHFGCYEKKTQIFLKTNNCAKIQFRNYSKFSKCLDPDIIGLLRNYRIKPCIFFVAPIICNLSSLITIFVIFYLNLCQNWPKDLYRYSVFMNYYEDVSRFGDIDIVLYPRNVSLCFFLSTGKIEK